MVWARRARCISIPCRSGWMERMGCWMAMLGLHVWHMQYTHQCSKVQQDGYIDDGQYPIDTRLLVRGRVHD